MSRRATSRSSGSYCVFPSAAARPVPGRGLRGAPDDGAVCRLRLTVAVLLGQYLAEVAVCARIVRLERDGLAERGLGLRVQTLPVERDAESAVEHRMVRPCPERLAIRRLGLDVLALATQAEREVRACLHRVGTEPDRGAQRD